MEIFHMDNDNTHLFFRFGYKVSPEDEFSQIREFLIGRGVEIGKAEMMPYCDVYKCKVNALEFNLIADLNYGCSICADEGCIKDLEEMLRRRCYKMEIATSNDYITFDEFISRLFELRAECNHEHYLCEIFIPFLKSCSIDGVKIVPVFDDRATGPKTEATTPTKERMATICAKKDDGNYVVPDYIYVPLEYSFNNPMNPYLMVETKKPAILDDGIHYRDLSDYISENESEIRAEINAFNRGYVLFTDGLTWMFLTIVDDQIVESPKYETIRLIDKYEKYHKTNRVKAKHQDKHVDLSYIGLGRFDVEIEPNEWDRLKEQIRKMLTELKGE